MSPKCSGCDRERWREEAIAKVFPLNPERRQYCFFVFCFFLSILCINQKYLQPDIDPSHHLSHLHEKWKQLIPSEVEVAPPEVIPGWIYIIFQNIYIISLSIISYHISEYLYHIYIYNIISYLRIHQLQ